MPETLEIDHNFFRRYRWGIVDASQRELVPDSWKPSPIAPSFLGKDIGRCPLFVDLRAIPDADQYPLLDQLATAKDRDCLLSLALESEAPPERLLAHLRKRLEIHTSIDQQPMQFRYYDPGTFLLLPKTLGESGMRWLLGPITAVAVPWCSEWRRYCQPELPNPIGFELRDRLPELLGLGAINRVLAQLEIRNQEEWCHHAAVTSQYIARAQAHGLIARDDLVTFALHAWIHHPNFDDHWMIRNLLQALMTATPEDEIDYRELSARLDEADWQKIIQEMNAMLQGTTT